MQQDQNNYKENKAGNSDVEPALAHEPATNSQAEEHTTKHEQDEPGNNSSSSDFQAKKEHEEPEHQFNVTPEGNSFTLREESPEETDTAAK